MRDFNPTSNLRPQRFQFADDTYGGSGLRSGSRRPFTDAEEMELALELLEVTSEAELEQFLGKFFKKAWRGIKKVGSKVIRPLVKMTLPIAARIAGTFFGGPVGGAIAGKLGSLVSQALEAETAGLAPADRDLEKCRRFVRMAGQAASAAASAPPGTNPVALAEKVLADSARRTLEKKAGSAGTAAPSGKAGNGVRAGSAASPMAAALKKAESRIPIARCTECGKSAESCSCGKVGEGGGWIRRGRTIIVNY